jgi:hypothetical protein
VVFDDSVVYDGKTTGDVRVSIAFGWHAVRSPARVRDAERSRELITFRAAGEFSDPAHASHPVKRSVHYGDTC